jgi:hypothetical protein
MQQGWVGFFGMIGGVAATLLGLLFVSVSVNAGSILGKDHIHSKSLAEQAFQNYLAVLTVSLIEYLPNITTQQFGYVVLGTTAVWSVWVIVRAFNAVRHHASADSRRTLFRRYLASLIGFGMLVYSGIEMSLLGADERGNVAMGLMLLLLSATITSWDLLIRVAQEKRPGDQG